MLISVSSPSKYVKGLSAQENKKVFLLSPFPAHLSLPHSLPYAFSLPSSVPQFLSLEREPLFLDISLAERLCFLKMMHYRAPEISAFPNHTPATLPLLSSSDLPSFWPLQSLCPCCFSCLQHSTWFSQVSLMMSAVERQATVESWAPVLGREKERRARR